MCAVMCCLLLVGCGDSKYVGTWAAEYEGEEIMTIELKKDHKASMTFMGMSSGEDEDAKWKVDGKKIVLSDPSGEDDETIELEIKDGSTLTMSESGQTLEFKKK